MEGTSVLSEHIDRVVARVSKGDISIVGHSSDPTLQIDFGGIGGGDVGHQVEDGVLYLDYACGGPGLCGGDLTLTVPPQTPLDVWLGAGNLEIVGMDAEIIANVGGGAVSIEGQGAPPVMVVADTGSLYLGFVEPPRRVEAVLSVGAIRLRLPSGAYALDLDTTGLVTVDPGILDDPLSPHQVSATARGGGIFVWEGLDR
ncbi:MAG TPA: hypothetical protein ENK18_07025 [Deltaproteobacteria bacterium]|nr:hypothetical protein [Deltaproteobacteria bacterium]